MSIKTYPKTDKSLLTKNFKVSEFKCKCGKYCQEIKIDEALVALLQKIRDHFGVPVTINSAYRCPVHNQNVGGVPNSRHVKGQAADIVVKNVSPRKVAQYAQQIGIPGIGLYETDDDGYFVHVDTRENVSYWYGQNSESISTFLEEQTLCRVQVGAYTKKENAEKMKKALQEAGFTCFITQTKGYYKVQTGAFSQKANAHRRRDKLKKAGFPAIVTM